MLKVIKIIPNTFENASRDKRELSIIQGFGCELLVFCKKNQNNEIIKQNDTVQIFPMTTKPLGSNNKLNILNRIISFFSWSIAIRQQKSYCISCHDLIALGIGWVSTVFLPRDDKPLIVYDSHEFEMGRNSDGTRGVLSNFFIAKIEKFLMHKSALSIMVNDSIADAVFSKHKLKERPTVVRNIPAFWKIDEEVCKETRLKICSQLKISPETFIVMYHGSVIKGRGIENVLQAISSVKNVVFVILGDGDVQYLKSIEKRIIQLGVKESVLMHKAVPLEDLWKYVGAADVGISLTPNTCMNHYYMLPNKLFENIQSMTPIIGSDFPEIRKIINKYDIGLLVDPESIEEISRAIEQMRCDKPMYFRFKENLIKAKAELCWEKESQVLIDAYRKIFKRQNYI